MLSSCDGHKTIAELYVSAPQQIDPNLARRHQDKEAWICPGDPVFLYSGVSPDVRSASVAPRVGTVKLPIDTRSDHPTASTSYTLTARGDDTVEDTAQVFVVTDGMTRKLTAVQVSGANKWQVSVPVETTSPSIGVMRIRVVPCDEESPVWWPKWSCTKTSPQGDVEYVDVTSEGVETRTPLVGKWEFVPVSMPVLGALPPETACFEVTLTCAGAPD